MFIGKESTNVYCTAFNMFVHFADMHQKMIDQNKTKNKPNTDTSTDHSKTDTKQTDTTAETPTETKIETQTQTQVKTETTADEKQKDNEEEKCVPITHVPDVLSCYYTPPFGVKESADRDHLKVHICTHATTRICTS